MDTDRASLRTLATWPNPRRLDHRHGRRVVLLVHREGLVPCLGLPVVPSLQTTVARLGTETLWGKACACLMGGEGAASLEQLLAVRVRAFVNIDRSHPPLGVCHGERFLPQTPRSGTVDIDYPSSPVPITFTWSYLLW